MAFVSMIDLIYPVGSIYQSMNSTSPATLFGGTWAAITTFLYGSTTAGNTGGEALHYLTIEELPYHDHGLNSAWCGYSDWTADQPDTLSYSKHAPEYTSRTLGSWMQGQGSKVGENGHNNLPPYTTCFIWKRTA